MYQFISISKDGERIHASRDNDADCLYEMRKYHRVIKLVPGVTTSDIVQSDGRRGFTATTVMGHVTVFILVEVAEVEA